MPPKLTHMMKEKMKKVMLPFFITSTMIMASGDVVPIDPIASEVKK
jgi:hypothetical protein